MSFSSANVNVLFFAKCRELAGIARTSIELPSEIKTRDLLDLLCDKYNIEIVKQNLILAVNENYCEDIEKLIKLKDGDEIAVIPPISGGNYNIIGIKNNMNYIKIQNEKLDVGDINALVADESCGAISMFIGTTRDSFEDKKVICLEYEAYEPMAIKFMNQLCDNLRSKWPDLKHIAIYHRLGVVPVKEASVVIAISSPHRLSSLQAVQYAIDELKRMVPIWKKEKYDNNSTNLIKNSLKKRLKREKLDFNKCEIDTAASITLPKGFVQINANEEELSRRIQCFIEKKREEIDINNILDFTNNSLPNSSENNEDGIKTEKDEGTCARINSTILRQNNSKGHLKVHRVKNEYGPQTVSDYTNALDKLTASGEDIKNRDFNEKLNIPEIKPLPIGISERLEKVEKYFRLPLPVSKDVYQRLKIIEDKINFLETISPEYRHFLDSKKSLNDGVIQKKKYTAQDLDNYIAIFKNKK